MSILWVFSSQNARYQLAWWLGPITATLAQQAKNWCSFSTVLTFLSRVLYLERESTSVHSRFSLLKYHSHNLQIDVFATKNSKIELVARPGDDEFLAGNRDGLWQDFLLVNQGLAAVKGATNFGANLRKIEFGETQILKIGLKGKIKVQLNFTSWQRPPVWPLPRQAGASKARSLGPWTRLCHRPQETLWGGCGKFWSDETSQRPRFSSVTSEGSSERTASGQGWP